MDADFFSVRRLTLWSPPLTAGTRRVSAPSRLAQRDVAKAWYPANLVAKFARLSFQGRGSQTPGLPGATGAEPKTADRDPLADVSQTAGTGRFEGNRTTKNYLLIVRELTHFLKDFRVDADL